NRLRLSVRPLILILIVVLVALAIGLLLDLRFHGLAWRALYSVTGEENPAQQIYGFIHYLGNWTRRQPMTATSASFKRFEGNPRGVNTFLEQEVEESKRERQMQMIADAGFGWIRQQFPWFDIEISGRRDFTDRRNDPQGVDAWQKYDQIVDVAERYH